MGGRGSLSPNKHKMYDKATIKREMAKYGIRVVGVNNVSNTGLSLVVEALETVQALQKRHGKMLDSVVIGVSRNSDFAFNSNFKAKSKGKEVALGRTLIIPKKTVEGGRADLLREVKYAHRNNIVVAKNIKQMIVHEYGHAMHYALKTYDPVAYQELNRKFNNLVKNPKSRVHLSAYAQSKAYNGKISSHEYVAEAITHLVRNTTSRKGQDMIDLTRDYIGRVPTVDFSRYGMRKRRGTTAIRGGRTKTIKRKPKTR